MELDDVQAVIDSARARGTRSLERFVRDRLSTATEPEVQDAVNLAVEIIEMVPLLLAQARIEARDRNLEMVVLPILAHAKRYFIHPADLIPEMTQGMAGLLDDTYLVLKILQNLQSGPVPLLETDLDQPVTFLRRLVGERVGRQLDAISLMAIREIGSSINEVWQHMAHEA